MYMDFSLHNWSQDNDAGSRHITVREGWIHMVDTHYPREVILGRDDSLRWEEDQCGLADYMP